MDKKSLLIGAVVVWFGLSIYWYVCRIKGQCQQPGNFSDQIEVVDSDTADVAEPKMYTVYFQPSSATYINSGTVDAELKTLADYMKSHTDKKVTLTGYTANLGRTAGYQQMSLTRANMIKQKFIGLGVAADQIVTEAKGISGQASTASEEDKAKSRRVEILISPK